MKKELVLLGSMIAMSGALSSCCCKRSAEYAYAQNRQNVNATAPRVVNYKDGGTPGYIQPTSAEGTTLTQPVSRPVYQQPVQKQSRCSQIQPVLTAPVLSPVPYRGPVVVPQPGVIEAHMNYSNSGVLYNAAGGGCYGGSYRYNSCPRGDYGYGHYPTWHWGNCR